MVSSVNSPADVANLVIRRLGYKITVGSLLDGSAAAKAFLDVYGQTRDALLREGDWGFAERNAVMNVLKQAPVGGYIPPLVWSSAYPPLPWLFEYEYPDDCLRVRSVKPTPILFPNMDPQPYVFSIDNDPSLSPPQKVILCNVPQAILVYAARVTDPQNWEADFTETLVAALARRLAPTLASPDFAKFEAQDEQVAGRIAANEQG